MNGIFSKKIINTGRQTELDIARGLAVLFMILIHVQQSFLSEEYLNRDWAQIIDFLGGVPAAPVFMTILGVGLVYSKKNDYKTYFRRGLLLILAGYILNVIRGFLPYLIGWLETGQQKYLDSSLTQLFIIDILQLAGLTFIAFGIFKYFKLNNYVIALVGVFISVSNFFLVTHKTGNLLLSAITGLFWGSSSLSAFPFFSWFFYPVGGYLLGNILIRCSNKKLLYFFLFSIGWVIWFFWYFVLQETMGLDIGLFSDNGYYHHTLLGNIAFMGFVLGWISFLFFISGMIPDMVTKTIDRWSKNVTEIYFAQWVIIGWLLIPFTYIGFNLTSYAVILLLTIIASDISAYFYIKVKKRKINIQGDKTICTPGQPGEEE